MLRRWQDVVFGILCAGVLAVAVLCVLVASGYFVSNAQAPAPPSASRRMPPAERAISSHAIPTVPVRRRTETQPVAAHVSIAATRGDCWVVAHSGSQSGPVLLERVVHQGETVTLNAPRVWLELGAAGNVDVLVNGRARPIPVGTTDLVLG